MTENKTQSLKPGNLKKILIPVISLVVILGAAFAIYKLDLFGGTNDPVPSEETTQDQQQSYGTGSLKAPKPKETGTEGESEAVSKDQGKGQNKVSAENSGDEPEAPTEPKVTKGTLSLDGGTWHGEVKNGKANGSGTITFSHATTFQGCDVQSGYRFSGEYEHGQLSYGALYDENGVKIKSW